MIVFYIARLGCKLLKLWLRRVHLLLALVSGLFIICLSLTGALLIYAKDIQYIIQPEQWLVEPSQQPLSYQQLTDKVTDTTGHNVTLLMPEQRSDLAWQLQLANKQYASVNPYTGAILHQYEYYSTLYGFTMALHRWLLYENNEGEKSLRNWVSSSALIFIITILVGVYLWAKPNNRRKRLVIKPKAKLRILLYQLHTVIGMYLFIPLILIAFTGVAFNWKDETKAVLEFVTQDEVASRPPAPVVDVPADPQTQLTQTLHNAQQVFPKGQLYRIYFAKKPNQPVALRIKNPGETHAYSWVWANPYTAQVLASYDASKANFTSQAWDFRYKFHIGDFAGSLVQALWLFIALTPVFFTLSGFYFWYKRHNR